MLYKKLEVFSAFLLLGIAALFLPSTALQNSIAMGQEFYPEYEENQYYDQKYDPYNDNNNNYNNAPIVNVEKKLFICNNVTDSLDNFFACVGQCEKNSFSFHQQ